jgi:DNA-binding Lrp family transcriptional regulator
MMVLTDLHKHLLNDFQRDFPLSPTPFRDIAERLGVAEDDVLDMLREMAANQTISRVGPVFAPHRIGISTLAAMAVPEERLADVAARISALPEVNHNYEREHRFNLWFVLTAPGPEELRKLLERIERQIGISVMSLPLLEDFHIDLGFPLDWEKI